MKSSDLDALQQQAKAQGMMLVDSSKTDELFTEYDRALIEADRLAEVVDPENKPFDSKYKARDILEQLAKQLEANKAIAMLDNNIALVAKLRVKLANLRTKLGLLCWDCEEPHNAQTELEEACGFYFPGLIQKIEQLGGEEADTSPFKDAKTGCVDFEAMLLSMPPHVKDLDKRYLTEGMRCLNILGIVWSGRGQCGKAVLYLLTAQQIYEAHPHASTQLLPSSHTGNDSPLPPASADTAQPFPPPPPTSASDTNINTNSNTNSNTNPVPSSSNISSDPLEHCYTHTLFYLAQAYGHLQDMHRSSQYCRRTLQRQLDSSCAASERESEAGTAGRLFFVQSGGKTDIKAGLEWVKNCAGMGDYYLAIGYYKCAHVVYASAESVLRQMIKAIYEQYEEHVKSGGAASGGDGDGVGVGASIEISMASIIDKKKPNYIQGNINAAEIEAELHRRFAILDVRILKRCMEGGGADDEDADQAALAQFPSQSPHPSGSSLAEIFIGLPVSVPQCVFGTEVQGFEQARLVFLRAAARLESSKKYFVLDGYVTDHVTLLQEHSKLYHYLSAFEPDLQRKLAMQLRRVDMLKPLLKSLSRSSYEVLHKQISYELGETSLTLIDLYLDKLRQTHQTSSITEQHFTKKDITKYMGYIHMGLCSFTHFVNMYAPHSPTSSGGKGEVAFNDLESKEVRDISVSWCENADESQITAEEVRPFLNAHFLSCRILQKIPCLPVTTPPPSPACPAPSNRAFYLIQCLKRYNYIQKMTSRLCEKRELKLDEVFEEELRIVADMISLLPSKVDRVCYRGESGLTL